MLKRLLSLGAVMTVLAGSLLAQKPVQLRDDLTYKTSVVRVKFKADQTALLDAVMKSGDNGRTLAARGSFVELGMTGFDAASKAMGADEIRRVFRPAGKFEARHRAWGLHLWYEVSFSDDRSLQDALQQFGNAAEVVIAEPVEIYELVDGYDPMAERTNTINSFAPESIAGGVPNDPSYSSQWGWPAISAAAAWEIETGNSNVVVAIEDQGVDYRHEDLDGNMWINSGEIAGDGIDNDNNGYVDDYYGYNFGDNTGEIAIDYHGTHVGGTVSAETNNGVGVAGAAGGSGSNDGVRLMSLSVFGATSQGGFDEAFIYAADMGAAISQNSWGGGSPSAALENAIDYFRANGGGAQMDGGLVVFAAGNDGSNSASMGYPGSYASCMAVASVADDLTKSSFSNYGTWVDISAPGSAIYSTYPIDQGYYNSISGTSMACPHVSGVAALVLSNKLDSGMLITDEDLWGILTSSAQNIDAENPNYVGELGAGLVNAYSALTGAIPPPPPPPPCYEGSGDVTLTLLTDNYGSETSWDLVDSLGNLIASGSGYANNTTYTETFTGLQGRHTFTIYDSYGDGICCSYGSGNYELKDASGTVLKSGGAFASKEATDICISQGPNTPPVADAGGPYSGDQYANITFDASGSSDADGNSLSYSWDFGDGSTGSGVSPTHAYQSFGTFTATVTVSDGVDSDVSSATVTVNEVVAQPMTTAISTTMGGNGPWSEMTATITVTSNSAAVEGANVSITWSGDDTSSNSGLTDASGQVSFTSARVKNGSFSITINDVTKAGYYWDGGQTTAGTTMSVTDVTSDVQFALYPNPASDMITVMIPGNGDKAQAVIYRMNGQAVTGEFNLASGEAVNVSNLAKGMYIISIQTQDGVYTERFMKQ